MEGKEVLFWFYLMNFCVYIVLFALCLGFNSVILIVLSTSSMIVLSHWLIASLKEVMEEN